MYQHLQNMIIWNDCDCIFDNVHDLYINRPSINTGLHQTHQFLYRKGLPSYYWKEGKKVPLKHKRKKSTFLLSPWLMLIFQG